MSHSVLRPVGSAIRVRREALGLTKRELARRTQLNEKTIQRIEAGKRFPLPVTLDAIARALDCDPDALR